MSSTHHNPQPGSSSTQHSQNSALNKGPEGGGGANVAHGQVFHLRLAMLLVLRLLELKQSNPEFKYSIWLEKAGYGKFDDIVLKYKEGSGNWIQICLQCKSGEEKIAADGTKFVNKVSAQDFLSDRNKSFSLLEYIQSFSQIRNIAKDCDSYYVLLTNREYSGDRDGDYSFLERKEIDLASAQMFSDILSGKAFQIKYNSELYKEILKLNKKKNIQLSSKTIEAFCEKFLFVCDNRMLDVEVQDKILVRSNGNLEKNTNLVARLRSKVLDMYQCKGEPTHSDFLNLLNSKNIYYKNHLAHAKFTGRLEYIKEIRNALLEKKGVNILDLSVTGMVGMGKTQVVRKYINDNMHQFRHIICINADSKHTLDSSFVDLAKNCQLITEDGKRDITVVTKDVYAYFSEQTLFMFDNANEVLLFKGNTDEYIYLPSNAASFGNRFVVISQSTKWITNHSVTIDTFSEEEALLYLDEVITECTRQEKQDLAASVQYWPLALYLAASYVKQETENSLGRKSLSDVIRNIQINNEILHTYLPQQYEMEPNNASLRSLWQQIQADLKTKSDLSLKIIHILSFSCSDNFPKELLNFDSCTDDQVVKAITILRDNSLVAFGDNNVSIHSALQAVIRNSVKLDTDFHNHILVLGIASFEKYLNPINDNECRIIVGNFHMLTFLQHASESQVEIQTYVKMAGFLFHQLVESCDIIILGKVDNIFKPILLKTKQHLGVKCIETQNMLSTKASMLDKMGKYDDALIYYNHVIDAQTEMLGKDHPDTVNSIKNKAIVLNKMGKYDEALRIFNNMIDVQTENLGRDHLSTITSMKRKASVLINMGKHDEALIICNNVIEVQTEKLGKDHPDTLESMHCKASVLDNMGKYDEALSTYNQVIDVGLKKLGKDHPRTLASMHNKAFVLKNLGKYGDAFIIYNHVIKVRTAKLGKYHPDTVTSLHNRAKLLDRIEDYYTSGIHKKIENLY